MLPTRRPRFETSNRNSDILNLDFRGFHQLLLSHSWIVHSTVTSVPFHIFSTTSFSDYRMTFKYKRVAKRRLPFAHWRGKEKQDRQCTYNVTLMRVLVTIVAMENTIIITYSEFVLRLRYPACKAHAPCCHLWPARLCNIFPHYLINCTVFGRKKKILNTKCVFWFSLRHLLKTFLIIRRNERDVIKIMYISVRVKVPVILVRFQRHLNFDEIFLKK
jgi:hypothetical protein